MKEMENPILGVLFGLAFTAMIQSSGAVTGILIVLAGQGLITLEAGIAMAFGSNIGTCATAVLASMGKSRSTWQMTMVHIMFNVIGVILWVGFIPQMAELVEWVGPHSQADSEEQRRKDEVPRQLANAHTFFNFFNGLLALPFTLQMAALVQWLLPEVSLPCFVCSL